MQVLAFELADVARDIEALNDVTVLAHHHNATNVADGHGRHKF